MEIFPFQEVLQEKNHFQYIRFYIKILRLIKSMLFILKIKRTKFESKKYKHYKK